MKRVQEIGRRFIREENGASTTEYGLLIAFIAIAVIAVVKPFRDEVVKLFTDTTAELKKR
jgi:Flp pilus assembly pilin Flp